MQKQKGFSTLVGIIIIVAVVAIALGGVFAYQYFLAPKIQDQTAGWKTYINTQYGYQILVPKDWLSEGSTNFSDVPDGDAYHAGFYSSFPASVQIDALFGSSDCLDLTSCLKNHRLIYNASGDQANNLTYSTINGNQAAVESFTSNDVYNKTYYFFKNNTLYSIWFIAMSNTIDGPKTITSVINTTTPIFNQILSTFKFTN